MKLCMIGNRGHVNYVQDGLDQLPHVRVVGVCSGTPEDDPRGLLEDCRGRGHAPQVVADWRDMLDRLEPDMVSILGPFEDHARMCIEAFARGIHVLCEKPVALTCEQLRDVRRAHAESPVHFAAMMGLRYEPAFATAWQAVRDGAVGEVRLVDARKSYKLKQRPSYYQRRATYGGTILWVGSHAIDWIRWFSGKRFVSASARHSTCNNRAQGELESAAVCQFTLDDEVLATACIDYFRPSGGATHGDDRVRVVGTAGVIEVRHGQVFLVDGDAGGERQLPVRPTGRGGLFADFVGHVEGREDALLGAEDTLDVAEACILARDAADCGVTLNVGR